MEITLKYKTLMQQTGVTEDKLPREGKTMISELKAKLSALNMLSKKHNTKPEVIEKMVGKVEDFDNQICKIIVEIADDDTDLPDDNEEKEKST